MRFTNPTNATLVRRLLFALILVVLLAPACVVRPNDAAQIDALLRDDAAAGARSDWRARYRLYHPDFRAICPYEGFRAAQRPDDARVLAVIDLDIRHDRADATVRLLRAGNAVEERRTFVKDAGRWYLYATTTPCE